MNFTVKEMVSETSGLPPPPAPNSDPDDQPPPPPVEFAEASNEMLTYEAAGSCVGYGKSHVALHFKPTVATKFNVRVMQHQPQHVIVTLTIHNPQVPLLVEFAPVAGLQLPPLRVLVCCIAGDVNLYGCNSSLPQQSRQLYGLPRLISRHSLIR